MDPDRYRVTAGLGRPPGAPQIRGQWSINRRPESPHGTATTRTELNGQLDFASGYQNSGDGFHKNGLPTSLARLRRFPSTHQPRTQVVINACAYPPITLIPFMVVEAPAYSSTPPGACEFTGPFAWTSSKSTSSISHSPRVAALASDRLTYHGTPRKPSLAGPSKWYVL